MKKTLLVTLLLATLAFVFVGCNAEDLVSDVGLKKDVGTKDTGECTPSCDGKACGDDDGCGGKCVGTCPEGKTCNPNTFECEGGCTPNCDGKFCGDDDGCGGKCTACANANETCNKTTWKCESGCTPNCSGKFCGDDDGCGGKCTACANANETCNKTTWKCEGGCTPNCSGKFCGDDDGCGGKCTACANANETCNQTTWKCEGGCTPNCSGKFCGDDNGCGGKCTACPNAGEVCNQSTWKCEGGGACVNTEGGACNIDNNLCCEGLACVTLAQDQKDSKCYKDCTNDQTVCSSTQQCIGWMQGQGACFEVTTIANGTFSNCKSYKDGEEPGQTDQPGTASIKFSLGGISYNFTMCVGDFEIVDSSGTIWLIQIYDTSKLQTKKIVYLYNIIVDPSVHAVGQQEIGEMIQPVVYEIVVDSSYNTVKAMLHALGIDGTVNFTAVGTGGKAPTTGTLSNVLMMGYDWVICDNNAGNPCQ